MAGYTIAQLQQAGGNLWEQGDLRRAYFNVAALYGLTLNRYGSGNISSATLGGERISNRQASQIATALAHAKIWVNVDANGESAGISWRGFAADADKDVVLAALRRALRATRVEA